MFYSTCTVIGFRNGSIIADFLLGFTRSQNVTRLNAFLNRTLVNGQLFGGTIVSIAFNLTLSHTNQNNTNSTEDDDSDSSDPEKLLEMEQNSANEQQQQLPSRTTYTTVTYTTVDKGLSITISETITITNNHNLEKSPISNNNTNSSNYELILVPTNEEIQTVVVPTASPNPKSLPATTTIAQKSSPQDDLHQPIKLRGDPNFAYIDESNDDHSFSYGDGIK